MSQVVTDEQGNKHVFPDEATPEMIAKALGVKVGSASSLSMPRHAPMLAERPGFFQRALNAVQPYVDMAAGGAAQGVGDVTDLLQPGFEPALRVSDEIDKAFGINRPPATWRPGSEVAQTVYGGPIPQPQNSAQEYVQRGFRGATGAALFPGNMQTNAIVGAGSGVAGQGAVDVSGTRGTPSESRARLIGELLGGFGTAAGVGMVRSRAGQLFGEAIGKPNGSDQILAARFDEALPGVTDDQLRAAQALMDDAVARGTKLTPAEAIAQVTGRNTDLLAMQRITEQSRAGSRILDPMMANRPEANNTAFQNALSDVAPTPSASPETLAPRISEAANSVVDDANKARTLLTQKYYNSANPNQVAPTFGNGAPAPLSSLIDDIERAVDPSLGGVSPTSDAGKTLLAYRKALLEAADQNGNYTVGTLNNLYKEWRGRMESTPMESANSIDKTTGGILGPINKKLQSILEGQSPELQAGNQLYKSITENVVDPLKQGPTGRLANATTYDAVANTLMPANPKDITSSSIQTTINQLKLKNPDLIPEFVRTNLEAIWNQATRDLQAGPNQWGGANFAKAVAGNAEQEKILRTLIENMPAGETKWVGFRNFLDIMQAQGKRQFPGSATEFNRLLNQDLGQTNMSMVSRPFSWLNQMFEGWKYKSSTTEIARVFNDPKGVELLKQLAFTKPDNAKAAALAASLLALTQSNQPPARPNQ